MHLRNLDAGLGKRIQEVGSASVRNFARAAEEWFGTDLSAFNFYLMPLAFYGPAQIVESISSENRPLAARNLMNLIAQAEETHPSDENTAFNVSIGVQLRFVRVGSSDAVPVRVSREPGALPVELREEDIRQRYPWDYRTLTSKLRARYPDFKENREFHDLKNRLASDEQFARVRYLDPQRPRSGKKTFYSTNIIQEFDRHYPRR